MLLSETNVDKITPKAMQSLLDFHLLLYYKIQLLVKLFPINAKNYLTKPVNISIIADENTI